MSLTVKIMSPSDNKISRIVVNKTSTEPINYFGPDKESLVTGVRTKIDVFRMIWQVSLTLGPQKEYRKCTDVSDWQWDYLSLYGSFLDWEYLRRPKKERQMSSCLNQ